jgi:hypothetical protein
VKTALDILFLVLFLVVGIWFAIFGSSGLFLSERAGLTRISGFLIGITLGPLGLLWLAWRGRGRTFIPSARTTSAPNDEDADPGSSLLF